MKSILNFCAMLFAVGVVVVLLIVLAPEKIRPIISYLSIGESSVPNCSDQRTEDILFEIFSKKAAELGEAAHLSRDNFHLMGITTVSSENQNGRFYPTKFVCQAYLNIDISPQALDVISKLKKQGQVAANPLVQAMGFGAFLPNPELLESVSEINIEDGHISQSFQYTTQVDDEMDYQSVAAEDLGPAAIVIGTLFANHIAVETEKASREDDGHDVDDQEPVVKDIQVEGRHLTSKESIWDALNIEQGSPMSSFDPSAAQARIARLPHVASVTVELKAPDTIFVHITEK